MILQCAVFQRHIGVQPLQLGVLGFQALEALKFGSVQLAVLGFPQAIAGRSDAVLAADLLRRQARLRLVQDRYDLGSPESEFLHGTSPHCLIVPNLYFK